MEKIVARRSALALTAILAFAPTAKAETKQLTLCWAAWDPANALVELSKDFTAKTNVKMKFEFVPWPNFADRMLNELNSKGKLCDLIIGDSQWIGGAGAARAVRERSRGTERGAAARGDPDGREPALVPVDEAGERPTDVCALDLNRRRQPR